MTSPAVLHDLGGEGRPVLLIHGFGADRHGWAANAHALMPAHRVLAVDLPGHGAAGNAVGDGRPETLAAAVAPLIGGLAAPVALVGHSLGGAVALHLARILGAGVGPVVVIAPATLSPFAMPEFLDRFPGLEGEEEAEALLSHLVETPRMIGPMVPHVLAGLADPARRAALARIGAALPGAEPAPLGAPAALIWGEADRILPPPAALAPRLVPGAGHLPHVEKAGAVNRLIRAALAAG
jgi:pyruvate dehydrogenase E2 component (dihydrolipoamide acetyltransferase)